MTLTQIAFLLRREARQSGQARRTLPRGLTLTLIKKDVDWTLSLTREDAPPSEREVLICRHRFEIPDNATIEHDAASGAPKGESHLYHITRLHWTEELQQLSFAPPEGPNQYKFD